VAFDTTLASAMAAKQMACVRINVAFAKLRFRLKMFAIRTE